MRILIIHCAYQFKGGECNVVMEESTLLKEAGNRVRVLQFDNQQYQYLKLLQMPFNITSYIKTLKVLMAFRPDVVHIHNIHFGGSPSILYAVKKMNIPMVMTLHNFRLLCPSGKLFNNGKIFLDSLSQDFSWNAVKKGVYKKSRLLTFWLAFSTYLHKKIKTWQLPDQYIVLSEHAKELFLQSPLQLNSSQLTVKQNFGYEPPFSPLPRQEHYLFIGRLSKEKGIEILLEAFSKLEYTLKIAGDGPYTKQLKDYCENHPNIEYLGALKKDKIYRELQECSALIFPSIWYEGMPLTIIEAFACGTPVIATNLGVMKNMVQHEHNGFLFEAGSIKDCVLQLHKWFYMDQAEKNIYYRNCRKTFTQQYTAEKNITRLMEIYNAVIPKRRAALH